MKTQSVLLAALASAPAALAHTVFTDFFVDGMPQGDGVAMRMNPNIAKASSPIPSLDSDDMACSTTPNLLVPHASLTEISRRWWYQRCLSRTIRPRWCSSDIRDPLLAQQPLQGAS
ncbi:Glyco-hydro-61 domain containing protein [Pyrenophora tritici-repentis]|nr:Glyco-hydro-61 domain-containing protein [Pyrenophora tritici-repentis]KAG9377975.1 Glyco-hydro-61 domain containing protein [Pyrenophora tritici-repentis]KAI1540774.1 lytic polysaccharide monooxygenase [Pyrenophora tritici-repentis]KAI1574459.1 lytic polysaccharide monooxygenase [Pyrenophora tritici-repentis]KAI1591877.1 lytic polysaccharide monooxygenase [Pyrenophora tritici-repentis]